MLRCYPALALLTFSSPDAVEAKACLKPRRNRGQDPRRVIRAPETEDKGLARPPSARAHPGNQYSLRSSGRLDPRLRGFLPRPGLRLLRIDHPQGLGPPR